MLWFFITAPGLALFACQNAPALAQLAPIHGPTILLTASYPGANARVVADVVAAPLEEQINGADGLVRIESISRDDGRYSARLYFDRTIAERAAAQAAPEGSVFLPVGSVAPDFEVQGATRYGLISQPVRLSRFRGKTVVLAFYFRVRGGG